MVVGTRRSTGEGPDQPDTSAEDLLDALGRAPSTVVVDVERDPAAVETYVRRRLAGARDADRIAIDDPTIERVVELIRAQQRQFLFARLAIHEILLAPSLLESKSAGDLKRMLSKDHKALFAAAVDRLIDQAPVNGALLEALALAEGRGLPRADRIWANVASKLASDDVTETDIDNLLRDAASYVMLDAEDGQSVYRLAHQTFKEHFLARYKRRRTEPNLSDRHRLITRALISTAEQDLPAPPNPYLVHHLSAHVATADAWSELASSALIHNLDPADVVAERARTLLHRRPEAAEHQLRVALMRDPEHVISRAVLALALSHQAKHVAAVTEAKKAIQLAPNWWYPHYVAGCVLHQADREADALRAAQAALQIDPTVPRIWILLAWVHLAREEWWLSVQAARQGLTYDPHDSELVGIMTMALSEIAEAPGAMANAAEAVRLGPKEPLAHLAYGFAALAIGDTGNAASAFREALRLDPSMDLARRQLIEALKQRNPVYRKLFRVLKGMDQPWLPLAVLIPFCGILSVVYWVLWTADALLTWRLSRDRCHRRLLRGDERRAAQLSVLSLAGGAVMLAGGMIFSHPGTGIAATGLAMLALVTPIEETFATTTQPARRILGYWTASLAAALLVLLGISVLPTTPDALGSNPVFVMLAALVSVWVAAAIRWVFKRRHRAAAL
ncbi:hypothetical protein [Nocardia sp. CA-119907]|uniref:tetratricopeptide repeat protein n=1 Tax=Nocardia sp. CA-119907 TaxID=3239973 RepID=UPI003D96D7B9